MKNLNRVFSSVFAFVLVVMGVVVLSTPVQAEQPLFYEDDKGNIHLFDYSREFQEYTTTYKEDNTLEIGKEIVEVEGQRGVVDVAVETIVYKDGKEEVLQPVRTVVQNKVDAIVRVGTKQEAPKNEVTITYEDGVSKETQNSNNSVSKVETEEEYYEVVHEGPTYVIGEVELPETGKSNNQEVVNSNNNTSESKPAVDTAKEVQEVKENEEKEPIKVSLKDEKGKISSTSKDITNREPVKTGSSSKGKEADRTIAKAFSIAGIIALAIYFYERRKLK